VGWETGELNLGGRCITLLLILLVCLCSSWCQQYHVHIRGRLLLP
jgi:hypothetical protein